LTTQNQNQRHMKKLILIIYTIGACSALAMNDVKIQASSDRPQYCLGEPIHLTINIENNGANDHEIDLGANGLEKISIGVIHRGTTNTFNGPLPEGISRPVKLELPAGGSATISFFIDQFSKLNSEGQYELSVNLSGSDMSSSNIVITILPETKENSAALQQRYVEYATKLNASTTTDQEREYLRKIIVYSRNVAALELQEQIIKEREWGYREYQTLVCSLVDIKTAKSIKILVDEILNNPESTKREKYVVLIVLKVAVANKWEGEESLIIQPYADEIESILPISGW